MRVNLSLIKLIHFVLKESYEFLLLSTVDQIYQSEKCYSINSLFGDFFPR